MIAIFCKEMIFWTHKINGLKLVSIYLQNPVAIYEALCFDVAQSQMNGAPNETRTHSCRLASLAC